MIGETPSFFFGVESWSDLSSQHCSISDVRELFPLEINSYQWETLVNGGFIPFSVTGSI